MAEHPVRSLVVDASALVEALLGTPVGMTVRERLRGCELHAPAHLDAEVLSALGRLHRAGEITASAVSESLTDLAGAPIQRHLLVGLLGGAWEARDRVRLVDALYVELTTSLSAVLLTTDSRLARECDSAELVVAQNPA